MRRPLRFAAIRLVVVGLAFGLAFSAVVQAQTNRPPVAAFTYAPSSPLSGQAVTFTNTSTDADGDVLQYWWDFGDGQTSADGSPAIAYAAPGTYTVELMAIDNRGPSASVSKTIVVSPAAQTNRPPVAAFTYAPSSPVSGQAVTFTNTSTDPDGDPLQYWWTFGDGQASAAANPAITYTTPGTYTVELTAIDNRGSTSAVSRTVVVAQPSQLLAPVVQAVSATASRPAGTTATATFSVRNDNGAARTYALVATSSNAAVVADPADPAQITVGANASANLTVTYQVSASAAAGSTSVIALKATDTGDTAKTHSASFTHTTEGAQGNRPPVAAFTYAPSSPASGQPVTFTNTSTDADGDVLQYWWTFGDGQTSAAGNPAITYAAPGTYTVELTAIDNHGPTTSVSKTVVVGQASAPVAAPQVTLLAATLSTPAGTTATARFSVRNPNAATRRYAFQATSVNLAVVADPADPAQIDIGGGATIEVSISYTVAASAPAGSTSFMRLAAADAADNTKWHSDTFTHTTAQVIAAPLVSFPNGWVSGLRNTSYSVPMQVKNASNVTRTLCFAGTREPGYSNDVDNVTTAAPAVPGCQSFTAGETKTLPVSYTMANGDWDGDTIFAVVTATDQSQPSASTTAKFKISVLMAAEAPAPAALQAGKPHTYVYRFYNQDRFQATRTYDVTYAVTGAAVFQNLDVPSRVTIAAGQWGSVNVTFTVPAAMAGQTGALSLRLQDVDPNWPDRTGTAMASVTAVDVSVPGVSLPDGWTHGLRNQSYVARLVVRNNTNAPRRLCFASERGAGSGGTPDTVTAGNPTVPPCQSFEAAETRTLQIGYTMADSDWDGDGVQVFVTAWDEGDPAIRSTASTKISVLMNVEPPAPAALQAGGTYTQRYRFYNQDRLGTPHTYTVSHTATPGLFQNVSHPATVSIPAGAWGDVDVSFTLPAGSAGQTGALEVRLHDVDPHWPDRIGRALGSVTSVEVLPPSLQLPDGWRHGLRGQSYSVRLAATNNTAAPRTLCFSSERAPGGGGNADNVTTGNPTVPPCQLFGAHETRTLQVGYTMANSDWDGDGTQVTIHAWDEHDAARRTSESFKISVLMASSAPVPATLEAGVTHTYRYGFYNQDRFGMAHTYNVTTSVAGDPIFQGIHAPSTVTIAAGTWGEVAVAFTVPAGSAGQAGTLTVKLTETEPTWPDRIGIATASAVSGTISLANPTVTAPAGDTAPPGSQRTATFQVKNNSSASRTFSFAASSSNTSVVPDPLDPASRTIAAGAIESVNVQYTVFGSAAGGSSAAVTLAATDVTDTTKAGSAAFVVTVATAPAASDKFTGYSIFPSNLDHPAGIPIQLGAGHLDPRQTRQWIGWQGCAPNYHPNGDPDIAYTPNVPQFAAANPGKLYIFLDEPTHGTIWNHRTNTAAGCGQVTPEQYARAYHAFVQSVRAADPTARFSPGGFEQFRATPESYHTAFVDYAAEFAQKYQEIYGSPVPVDEWRFHVYWEWWPDPSDITLWREKANVAIRFANDRGKPVVLGIGYPWQEVYDARMLDGMSNMFAYLKDHSGVASVFWFSYDEFHDGHNRLTTHTEGGGVTRTLTPLGERYRSLIQGLGTPSTGSAVSVTPDAMNAFSAASAPGSQQFRVQNIGAATATYNLTQSCSGAVTTCGTPSPSQVTLSPGQISGDVSVSYAMSASGSGWLTLNAVQSGVAGVNDAGSYQLTATVPTSDAVDLSAHNGENVNLAQFGANLTYTTPSYVTMDVARSVTLFYSSVQASPRGFVQVEVNDAVPPQAYSILLQKPDGTPVTLINGATENFYRGGAGGASRLAVQFDASNAGGTGAYSYRVIVRRWNNGQIASQSPAQTVRVLVIDERNSPYGSGWSVVLPRMYPQSDGILLTDGTGAAKFFPRPAGCATSCLYGRPAGDWTDVRSDGTGYTRERRNGSTDVFGLDGLLKYQVDRFGNRTSYVFAGNRLTQIVDPVDHRITLNYAGDKLRTIDDGYGRVVTVSIDGAGDLRGIVAPDGVTELAPEYTNHLLQAWADRLGSRWDVSYDRAGLVAAITAPSVSVTENGVTWQTRPVARQQSIHAAVLPAEAAGATSLAGATPNVSAPPRLTVTDPREISSHVTVNRFGDPVQTWNALGQTTTLTRDAHSRVEAVQGPNGLMLRNEWESNAPLLKKVTEVAANSITSYTYTAFDQVASVTRNREETTFSFDGAHRISGIRKKRADGTWDQYGVTLMPDGRVASMTDPADHTVTYDYSETAENKWRNLNFIEAGTLTKRRTTFAYNDYGLRLEIAMPSDDVTGISVQRTEHDKLNRVTLSSTRNGALPPEQKEFRTAFMYLEEGGTLSTTVVDGRSNMYESISNSLGWVEARHDAQNQSSRYRYDRAGNVTEAVNRRGQKIVMEYDPLNRMSSRRDTSTNDTTTWSYDPVASLWMEVRNAEGTNRVSWDVAGRQTQEQVSFAGLSAPYTLASRYDGPVANARSRIELTSPWQRAASYVYDASGRLDRIVDLSSQTTTLGYNDDGETASIGLPANVNVTFGSTSQHVTSEVKFQNASTSAPLHPELGSEYTLDAQGRIRARWTAPDTALTYLYDFAGRLEEVWRLTYPVTPPECLDPDKGVCELSEDIPEPEMVRTHQIRYDDAGNNLDGITVGGNRMISAHGVSMSYDLDGNLKSKTSPSLNQTLEWNALGQLVAVTTGGTRVTFGYDGLGRRVRKSTPGGVTRYLHDGSNLFAELDANGQPLREYTNFPKVDTPLSVVTGGSTYYYLMDMPGHVVGMVDSAGGVANRYTYGPFGETAAHESGPRNSRRFGGREYDEETRLYYNRARYYDPAIGRFISEDPIGFRGGKNLYAYGDSDPVNSRDSSGRCVNEEKFNEMDKEQQQEALDSGKVCGQKLKRYDLPGLEACGDCLEGLVSSTSLAGLQSLLGALHPVNTQIEMCYPGGPPATVRARTPEDDYLARMSAGLKARQCNYWKRKALGSFVLHSLAQSGAAAGGFRNNAPPVTLAPPAPPPPGGGYRPGHNYQWTPISAARPFDDPNISAEWADAAALFCGEGSILP